MKTIKLRLLATTIVLTGLMLTCQPSDAQSRSSRDTESRQQRNNNNQRVVRKTRPTNEKTERTTINRNLRANRSSSPQQRTTRRQEATPGRTALPQKQTVNQNRNSRGEARNNSSSHRNERPAVNNQRRNGRTSPNTPYRNVRPQRNTPATQRNPERRTPNMNNRRQAERTNPYSHQVIRNNRNDRRFTPNNNYHGRNEYWNDRRRPHVTPPQHFSFRWEHHWNRNWEDWRWNYDSWRAYYRGYRPRPYLSYRNYYHHPYYGDVVRRFDFSPLVFIHNYHKYYCADGYFFRYEPGIGYIRVRLPLGFTFDYLPGGYTERVYINGYLYFRIGNLFFESSSYGFRLINYPERYYGNSNDTFYYDDDRDYDY